MATTKKNITAEETMIEKTQETIVEASAEKKAPAKRVTKKAAEKAENSEGVAAKASEEGKVSAKKTATKKSSPKKAAEVKCEIAVQFAGKSYSQDDLLKIAKDVWVYDLNRTEEELVNVELYVKPEDCSVYYVFNGTETGSFLI